MVREPANTSNPILLHASIGNANGCTSLSRRSKVKRQDQSWRGKAHLFHSFIIHFLQVDLSITSQALAGHVLSMCVSHSLQYSINFKPVKVRINNNISFIFFSCQGSIIEKVREDGEGYVGLFHPLPILRREVREGEERRGRLLFVLIFQSQFV